MTFTASRSRSSLRNHPGAAAVALAATAALPLARLQELHRQLAAGMPLAEIRVTP